MSNSNSDRKLIKGDLFFFISDPFVHDEENCFEFIPDGGLLIEFGKIVDCGEFESKFEGMIESVEVIDHSGSLIMPGFVDTHLHYPQTDIIASYGKQLLEWLQTYTFPREGMFHDEAYISEVVDFFISELLRNGTTTAQVMPTIHKQSVDIFFSKVLEKNMRMIAGKVMMDRNAPDFLQDGEDYGLSACQELIEKWEGQGRLNYALTPRFAVTSTEEQLKCVSKLLELHPDLRLHTHLSENREEVAFIKELFPWSKNYLDVYDKFGLLNEKSTFAHSIHLEEEEYPRIAEAGAAFSFCPTSNMFIGSGLFDLDKAKKHSIKVGMGSDVGGGTSFSMLRTLGEAYKVLQLKGQKLSALKAFYLATLGGAVSLGLEKKIGSFESGKEADFIVINDDATPLVERRLGLCETILEKLFVLMTLGDDRSIEASYVMGNKLYQRMSGD